MVPQDYYEFTSELPCAVRVADGFDEPYRPGWTPDSVEREPCRAGFRAFGQNPGAVGPSHLAAADGASSADCSGQIAYAVARGRTGRSPRRAAMHALA